MPITLGTVVLDENHTAVQEKLEEVGGRDERVITLKGLITGLADIAAIEAALDALLDAASVEDYSAPLSIRPGRRFLVRRNEFRREIDVAKQVGAFTLELHARQPFEQSDSETAVVWAIAASGATAAVSTAGNVEALPRIEITAIGDLVNPVVSDGANTIAYAGIVGDGETLTFDATTRTATLENIDVTPYTTGEFPRITPEGTTLTYTDDAASTHTAAATIHYRDRWW